nr:flagellin [uncultured Limnohabitans sp.]
MAVINTNVKALFSQAALKSTERSQAVNMQQLSTGKRINSSRDDAAGMAIATRMTQQIRSLNQAVRNAGDAITLIQTAEGATNEITDMMQRMRELAIQASNDTNNNDQRSYLDLEFQQLKKQIVQIADNTEWNGFPVLNGSTGERVGIKPVYKTTSEPIYNAEIEMSSSAPVSSTTGASGGVTQTSVVSFPALSTGQSVTVNGLTYTATTDNSAAEVAANFANLASTVDPTTLSGTKGKFSALSIGDIKDYASGPAVGSSVTYTSNAPFADVTSTDPFVVSAAGTGVLAPTVSTTTGVAGGGVLVTGEGSFAKAGILSITMAGATSARTAIFTLNDGQIIDISPAVSIAGGVVTISKEALDQVGNNLLKGGDVVFEQIDTASAPLNFVADNTINMSVTRSFKPLEATNAGDAIINGITIGATRIVDDKISRPENAIGSAIAKVAAINEKTLLSGVQAVVNPNIMTGTSMSGSGVAAGTMTINGFTTPMVKTLLDNPRESRALAVAAINFISAKTGVRAIDTFTEGKGITLVADDGRNIEVAFNTAAADADFSRLTGVKNGIQSGTYSLEGAVEQSVNITSAPNGDISRLGLERFNYTSKTLSSVTTMDRAVATPTYTITFSDLADAETVTVAGLTFTADGPVTGAKVAAAFSSLAAGSTPANPDYGFFGLDPLSSDFSSVASSGSSVIFSSSRSISSSQDIVVTSTAASKPTVLNTAPAFPTLGTGDLIINGVPIRAAAASDDTLSSTQTVSSARISSALATAAAINASSDLTGVTALTLPARIEGSITSIAQPEVTGDQSLFINGVNVVVYMVAGEAPAARRDKVIEAVKSLAGYSGVEASDNGNGGISLTAVDGRNVSVWFDSDKVNAGSFGLGLGTDTNNPPGVKGAPGATQTYTGANTVYGTVTLQSAKAFTVEPGDNGFTTEGDFTKLGFREGKYGGEVDEAVSKMSPPRTGRLAFQVGASAGQKITIDLADFGKGGPITGAITWDADLDPLAVGQAIPEALPGGPTLMGKPLTRTSIGSTEGAQAVLAKLDEAMDKVNQTRATMGAVMNRLDHVINNLTNVSMNLSASRSQIEDADYASASTELAKNQIMQQAATAVLAQANTSQQSVMKLLGG